MKTIAAFGLLIVAFMATSASATNQRQLNAENLIKFYQARIDVICDVCVVIVEDLDEYINQDTTQQEIIDFAKNLCKPFGWLWDGFQVMCDFYLEEHLPIIIDSIVNQHLSPENICTDVLGLCAPAVPVRA